MGQALVFIVVLLLSGIFLFVIPETLGIKVALFAMRKHFQSGQEIKVGKTSWWAIFACFAVVEAIIMSISALTEELIPAQRQFFPVYIYKAVLGQQLHDLAYVIIYAFLMIVVFFISGFVRVLIFRKRQINDLNRA